MPVGGVLNNIRMIHIYINFTYTIIADLLTRFLTPLLTLLTEDLSL